MDSSILTVGIPFFIMGVAVCYILQYGWRAREDDRNVIREFLMKQYYRVLFRMFFGSWPTNDKSLYVSQGKRVFEAVFAFALRYDDLSKKERLVRYNIETGVHTFDEGKRLLSEATKAMTGAGKKYSKALRAAHCFDHLPAHSHYTDFLDVPSAPGAVRG